VTFRIVGRLTSVEDGRLTDLAGGRGDEHAEFSLAGQCLVERRSPFDAKVHVSLGEGVPLLRQPTTGETPAVVEPPTQRTPRQGQR